MSKGFDLTIPLKKSDWKNKKNNLYKKPAYSNTPRRPKPHANVNVSNIKKGVSKLDVEGNMYVPLSPTGDIGAWLGGSERKNQFNQETFYSSINQNIKNRFRHAGFNFKNFKVNYKQQSGKGKWKEQHKFGPWERGGTSKSDIGRSLEFGITNVKLNKSGTLSIDLNVGIKRGHVGVGPNSVLFPDPKIPTLTGKERIVGRGPEHETVGTVGFKYEF